MIMNFPKIVTADMSLAVPIFIVFVAIVALIFISMVTRFISLRFIAFL